MPFLIVDRIGNAWPTYVCAIRRKCLAELLHRVVVIIVLLVEIFVRFASLDLGAINGSSCGCLSPGCCELRFY